MEENRARFFTGMEEGLTYKIQYPDLKFVWYVLMGNPMHYREEVKYGIFGCTEPYGLVNPCFSIQGGVTITPTDPIEDLWIRENFLKGNIKVITEKPVVLPDLEFNFEN